MNPFQKFVSAQERLFQGAKKIQPGKPRKNARAKISSRAPKALIFSPHPDDECIVGGLAVRLSREAKWNVVNIAVTLGSIKKRRAPRLRELENACASLGFGCLPPGLEQINLEAREKNRVHWNAAVKTVAKILAEEKPRVIFFPHENDRHSTHIGTHFLVLDALKTLPRRFECFVVETEFWGQMTNPNLLVELGVQDVGDLIAALSLHVGEVKRNPYHARLPTWLMDNVRRAEIVGEPGGVAPDFTFGAIYRLRKWSYGRLADFLAKGKYLSRKKNAATLFR